MMMRHLVPSLGLAMLVATVHVAPAWAQDAPARAYRGLFGGNARNQEPKQTLDLTTDIQGGQDDNLLAAGESAQMFDPRYQIGGNYGSNYTALTYSTGTGSRAFTVNGRAAGDFRYSPAASSVLSAPRYEGALSVGLLKTVGIVTLAARQSASYMPYRVLTAFPRFSVDTGIPVAVGRDFAISSYSVYGLNSEGRIGFQLGRRATFDVSYRRALTDYSAFQDQLLDQSLGGAYVYRMSRYASARLGYTYRLADYSGTATVKPVAAQNIDAGVDYNRPLSLTRKTSVTFTSGVASASDSRNMQYFATGGLGINQEIGRSWVARLMVNRALSYLDGFATPFLTNGVTTDIGGYLGRRMDFVVTGGYADSDSTLSGGLSRFTTYTGATRLRFALSRYGSVYAQYFYYQYRFSDLASAMQGLPPMMERRGARIGLTMWLPLLR